MSDLLETSPSPTPSASGRGAADRDLVTGAIAPTLLAFALPTLGSNILQSLNGSINTIWVGRFLGESAVAATANANTIMFLMFAAVFGFGMASTILIGQSMGRRDIEGARRAFGASIGLVLGGSLVIALVGWLFTTDILQLLATPAGAMPLAQAYLRVIFLALPALMLLTLLSMALRGIGDAVTPLWFTVLSVVLDSGLNPVFIRGLGGMPALGIAGSAVATMIASYVAGAWPARLRLCARPADPAARARGRLVDPDGDAGAHDRRQGAADGGADARRLCRGAGDDRAGQPARRRGDRRLWRVDAALGVYPDARAGAGRGGQQHGRAEYRRGPVGPGRCRHQCRPVVQRGVDQRDGGRDHRLRPAGDGIVPGFGQPRAADRAAYPGAGELELHRVRHDDGAVLHGARQWRGVGAADDPDRCAVSGEARLRARLARSARRRRVVVELPGRHGLGVRDGDRLLPPRRVAAAAHGGAADEGRERGHVAGEPAGRLHPAG